MNEDKSVSKTEPVILAAVMLQTAVLQRCDMPSAMSIHLRGAQFLGSSECVIEAKPSPPPGCCVQTSEELDITEKEGEFLTKESAEEKMARALSGEASIRRVCPAAWPMRVREEPHSLPSTALWCLGLCVPWQC